MTYARLLGEQLRSVRPPPDQLQDRSSGRQRRSAEDHHSALALPAGRSRGESTMKDPYLTRSGTHSILRAVR
jgi:hypothetical protein